MSALDAAALILGPEDVAAHARVRTFLTRYGIALEETFAIAVGGRRGGRGEPDVLTPLGGWEFCSSAEAKNSDGERAQRAKVGDARIVQVSGRPRPGRISAVAFLALHGVDEPERVAAECAARSARLAAGSAPMVAPGQLRLRLVQ